LPDTFPEHSLGINPDPAVNEMLKYLSDIRNIKPDSLLMVKPLKTEKNVYQIQVARNFAGANAVTGFNH
jgi:hypothetical protein